MNWLDLGIIVFIAIFLIIGIKKGLMHSVLQHFSFGINALLSFFLAKPIGLLYDKIFGLSNIISNSYSSSLISKSADFGVNLISMSSDQLHGFVEATLNKGHFSPISKAMFNIFLNNNSLYTKLHDANINSGLESRTLADIISNTYSSFFLTIISFVTSIILLYLVVWLFKLLVEKLRTVGFIKFVDNFLGIFYGLFRCLIIFIVLSLIIKLMSPLSFMNQVTAYINDSMFGKVIYSQINSFFDNYLNFDDLVKLITK